MIPVNEWEAQDPIVRKEQKKLDNFGLIYNNIEERARLKAKAQRITQKDLKRKKK